MFIARNQIDDNGPQRRSRLVVGVFVLTVVVSMVVTVFIFRKITSRRENDDDKSFVCQ